MARTTFGNSLVAIAVVVIIGGALATALYSREHSHPVIPAPARSPVSSTPPAYPTTPLVTSSPSTARGFQPQAVTAVSETQFWVLGTAGECTGCPPLITHTSDGGHTFNSVPAPPTQYANYFQSSNPTTISSIRFADGADGWAFGPGLWATHDGGASWRSIDAQGAVQDLEPGAGGYVYALVDTCTATNSSSCARRVIRSVATSDVWTVVLNVNNTFGSPPSLGVHGDGVWLLDGAALWASSNAGARFTKLSSPCLAELGGKVDPVTPLVVWAFCPTGGGGQPHLSTDGGAHFVAVPGGQLFSNGGMVAGLSASTAFVTDASASPVETEDGGATYHSAAPAGVAARWVGFTDSTVGYMLVDTVDAMHSHLYRTTDSGAHWTLVPLR